MVEQIVQIPAFCLSSFKDLSYFYRNYVLVQLCRLQQHPDRPNKKREECLILVLQDAIKIFQEQGTTSFTTLHSILYQ
jgi:hypothetical protein